MRAQSQSSLSQRTFNTYAFHSYTLPMPPHATSRLQFSTTVTTSGASGAVRAGTAGRAGQGFPLPVQTGMPRQQAALSQNPQRGGQAEWGQGGLLLWEGRREGVPPCRPLSGHWPHGCSSDLGWTAHSGQRRCGRGCIPPGRVIRATKYVQQVPRSCTQGTTTASPRPSAATDPKREGAASRPVCLPCHSLPLAVSSV